MTVLLEWAGVTVPIEFKNGEAQMFDAYKNLTAEVCRQRNLGGVEVDDTKLASAIKEDIICLSRAVGGEVEERRVANQAIKDLHHTLVVQNERIARVRDGRIILWSQISSKSLEEICRASVGSKTSALAQREIARRQGKLASA